MYSDTFPHTYLWKCSPESTVGVSGTDITSILVVIKENISTNIAPRIEFFSNIILFKNAVRKIFNAIYKNDIRQNSNCTRSSIVVFKYASMYDDASFSMMPQVQIEQKMHRTQVLITLTLNVFFIEQLKDSTYLYAERFEIAVSCFQFEKKIDQFFWTTVAYRFQLQLGFC